MTANLTWIAGQVTVIAAACAGAFISARLGWAQRDRSESARLRRETAEELVATLSNLRSLLRDSESSRDSKRWPRVVDVAFDAVDDARHRLPPGWRHLKYSIRASLGEAVGMVAFVDLRSTFDQNELATYSHRWNEYALEYIDLVLDSVRRWRDARAKAAKKITLASIDEWLARTGRYVPGGASEIN